MNRLQSVVVGEAGVLAHVTQLDVRDAGLEELDLRPLSSLELLRCDRNSLARLRVSGHALKALHAANNGTWAGYLSGRGRLETGELPVRSFGVFGQNKSLIYFMNRVHHNLHMNS